MVERYEAYVLSKEDFCDIEIEVEPEGSFVYYDDYAKLEAELEELRLQLITSHGESQVLLEENQKLRELLKQAYTNRQPNLPYEWYKQVEKALEQALEDKA